MSLYTDERNAQIVIQLLKENGIKRVIVSPGTTNASFVASIQGDSFFEVFSAPEERSAGYMACGMAAETGEPVVLSCTGATASRNYMPALTEAFYRKLPILAITSSRRNAYIGHNMHQVTDRTLLPRDVANISVQMPVVLDDVSEWQCIIAANKAIQELFHNGGGPAHINLETTYSKTNVLSIPAVRCMRRYTYGDEFPEIGMKKIAIFVGNHIRFSTKLENSIDNFCEKHNAIVFCDHTSNYKGKYRLFASLLSNQNYKDNPIKYVDLLIHIGNVSTVDLNIDVKDVWRVDRDGQFKDTFLKLTNVFELKEEDFFDYYSTVDQCENVLFNECSREQERLYRLVPSDLPFSSLWMASVTASRLPSNSNLHLGIRNSLKTWNYFDVPNSVGEFSNTGGFGIDGSISTVMGAALASPDKIFYCVLGDLAFFYDINAFGNRHFPKNIRILLVNNGLGYEMRGTFTLGHNIAKEFAVDERDYIAASGHYGQGQTKVVKHFVEDLGCKYMCASNKEEYIQKLDMFLDPDSYSSQAIVFETFVKDSDEDNANDMICNILLDGKQIFKNKIKNLVGDTTYTAMKNVLKG